MIFADGSTAEADVVIGADGINSRVRKLVIASAPAFYSGEVAHRSIFPAELLGEMRPVDHTKWWGKDCHILIYFIARNRQDIYFVTGVPQSKWHADPERSF